MPATSDITILKSEDYSDKWQKCATLTLPRKPSRVNVCLSQPIVAANLKIEFAKFYERPGGSKASDGSMLLVNPSISKHVIKEERWLILVHVLGYVPC
jgi:hypothetical protein